MQRERGTPAPDHDGGGSYRWISAEDNLPLPETDDSSEDDFEFAFVMADPDGEDSNITADEIFSNGQIRPVFPVFNRDLLVDIKEGNEDEDDEEEKQISAEEAIRSPLRRLLIEDRQVCSRSGSTSSSSSAEELEAVPPGTYCVWEPRSVPASPDRFPKKSSSTGTAHRWRLRDLVVGRSQSDGKQRFVLLAPEDKRPPKLHPSSPSREPAAGKGKVSSASPTSSPARGEEGKKGKGKGKGKTRRVTEMDMVTAHRLFYGKDGSAASGRRSFLPYKPVGLFANVKVLSRTHHPF